MTVIMDSCDGNNPDNPMNWKHGGSYDLDKVKFEVIPNKKHYVPGICSFHVHQIETYYCADLAGTLRRYKYTTNVTAKDSKGNILFTSGDMEAGDPNSYKMGAVYYDTLVLTPESRGDYIQFNLGGQSWTTKDVGAQGQKCKVGDWDSRLKPTDYSRTGRDMDCSMQC
ncbi:uncharacterized protein BP5553_02526 [Venustampulla echinocandica]|uniref:Uncharacterized protein n=1 Tax=Venustampulla echinocandica TaxID=2656787 RepID=A0A370U448_9HELO|nr:uncharacterized protein BP5553_02526 [Venustampulla echinocandica]RDL42547.1 hypothetical protein BP5553_02526 [Venustampulla echinocandica]